MHPFQCALDLANSYRRRTNGHLLPAVVSLDMVYEHCGRRRDTVEDFNLMLSKDVEQPFILGGYVGNHSGDQTMVPE
jgi:hypothetical protein